MFGSCLAKQERSFHVARECRLICAQLIQRHSKTTIQGTSKLAEVHSTKVKFYCDTRLAFVKKDHKLV